MSIINTGRSGKKIKVSLQFDSSLLQKIESYCEFVGIDDMSYFFEEATKFIFSKDKKWKDHVKTQKATSKEFSAMKE